MLIGPRPLINWFKEIFIFESVCVSDTREQSRTNN